MSGKRVLISGASIAGLTLAHWLDRYGFAVTVVEKAGTVRGGGYPIDIRGTARQVVERTGILSPIENAHIDTQSIHFVRTDGRPIVTFRPDALSGGVSGRDFEVPRGALTSALVSAISDTVRWVFQDSIAALVDDGDEVRVTFDSGERGEYDLVLGSDGLHSNTRELVFGPEGQFHSYLGYCFAGFSIENFLGAEHGAHMWNAPAKSATLLAPAKTDTLHAFLTFHRENPPVDAYRDPGAQRQLVADTFAGHGWHVPRMVDRMAVADDLFFDVVSQIHMPEWTRGRVALAGDAAHATSFMSGQGSSVALVGAYVLAGELATHDNHADAFAAYERLLRPFAEQNQALAKTGKFALHPATPPQLFARNQLIKLVPLLTKLGLTIGNGEKANTGIVLPEYESGSRR